MQVVDEGQASATTPPMDSPNSIVLSFLQIRQSNELQISRIEYTTQCHRGSRKYHVRGVQVVQRKQTKYTKATTRDNLFVTIPQQSCLVLSHLCLHQEEEVRILARGEHCLDEKALGAEHLVIVQNLLALIVEIPNLITIL